MIEKLVALPEKDAFTTDCSACLSVNPLVGEGESDVEFTTKLMLPNPAVVATCKPVIAINRTRNLSWYRKLPGLFIMLVVSLLQRLLFCLRAQKTLGNNQKYISYDAEIACEPIKILACSYSLVKFTN